MPWWTKTGDLLVFLLTEGQMNDHKGAKLVFDALPPAPVLIGDKGYDRCAHTFFSAICLAASVICYLKP